VNIDIRKQSNSHLIRLKGDLKIGQPADDLRKRLEELLARCEDDRFGLFDFDLEASDDDCGRDGLRLGLGGTEDA